MLRIGGLEIENPLLLAPMEDVTSLPFRLIAKRIGRPGLMFTEFVSAMAARFNRLAALRKMRVSDQERPLGIQIFGGDPESMAEAACLAEEAGADLVDINMGCWVPKVCRTGAGASLLKDPDMAVQIVRGVVRAVRVPVTVKVRAGWDYDLFAAPELARRFVAEGAAMITLHARFARQGFDGTADWTLIEAMRKAVSVPLVGNGDVRTADDASRMMRETGCDGVMVGRVAISNPWALAEIRAGVMGEATPRPPSLDERVSTALEHLRLAIDHEREGWEPRGEHTNPELQACRSLRGQLPLYVKGAPGAAALRARLSSSSSYSEAEELLLGFLQDSASQTCAISA